MKDVNVRRSWRCQTQTERYLFVSTSVHHPQSSSSSSAAAAAEDDEVEADLIAGHYLIEPLGAGKSRLTHLASIDFR